jgi:hypothetical protein
VCPDLVLLDLHMPHVDGFEVLDRIVEETPDGGYVPVLVLTADVTPEAKQRALSRGARDFLVKPLDATETLLRIRNLLETRLLHQDQARARRAAEESERRARFLAEASRVLGASFDYHTTLGSLARVCVSMLADFCIVDVLDGDGTLSRVGCAHVDPAGEELLQKVGRFAGEAHRDHPVLMAMREGRSVLVADVQPYMIEQVTPDPNPRDLLLALSPRSVMCVPIAGTGHTIGILLICSTRPDRRFGPDDLALAVELARRASLAIENARLFHEARQATRSRDEMLAIVAHDLRNPLNTISMGPRFPLRRPVSSGSMSSSIPARATRRATKRPTTTAASWWIQESTLRRTSSRGT